MPGNGQFQVKCEPPSDDEDNCPQLSDIFPNNKSSSSLEELAPLAPAGPAATPVCVKQEPVETPAFTLETLESNPHSTGSSILERHNMVMLNSVKEIDSASFTPLVIKDEPSSEGEFQQLSSDETSDGYREVELAVRGSPKSWTQRDMDHALDALRNHHMSLTKASATYGIPSTTLWQRAHRLGIDTPKKEGSAKSWSETDLRGALHALRAGAISANKASKAYGIPSSTLYKIARREGIRLAAPFNAAPVSWRRGDLARALAAIRAGAASVQRAAAQYGIPTGTLYGRCKREGIELSRSNPTPWSEDAMGEALEAVRVGQMSINQAAIHYNLPYSSLYGRFKRCKYLAHTQPMAQQDIASNPEPAATQQDAFYYHQSPHSMSEPDHNIVQSYSQNDYIQHTSSHNNGLLQDPYAGQPMYYNPNFNGITTS